jgi:hypothetical protein
MTPESFIPAWFSAETFRWLFSGLFILFGWVVRGMFGDLRTLTIAVSELRLHVAQSCVLKADYRDDLKEIRDALIRIEAKVDVKTKI